MQGWRKTSIKTYFLLYYCYSTVLNGNIWQVLELEPLKWFKQCISQLKEIRYWIFQFSIFWWENLIIMQKWALLEVQHKAVLSFSRNSLDPDPDSMNMDPKHWENPFIFILIFLWFAVRNDKTKNRVQAKNLVLHNNYRYKILPSNLLFLAPNTSRLCLS